MTRTERSRLTAPEVISANDQERALLTDQSVALSAKGYLGSLLGGQADAGTSTDADAAADDEAVATD